MPLVRFWPYYHANSELMKLVIVGIGGPSSSGKTSVCNGLRATLSHCTLIHLDEFYLPDRQIPVDHETNWKNWDCPESINWPKFLQYIEKVRKTPGDVLPVQSLKLESNFKLTEHELHEARTLLHTKLQSVANSHIVLIDGFMLYHDPKVYNLFDVKLFFRAPYEILKERREARAGYATEEGFWVDPPGYFDKIVWPQYVLTHQHLFEQEDVEGILNENSIKNGLSDICNDKTISIRSLILKTLEIINDSL